MECFCWYVCNDGKRNRKLFKELQKMSAGFGVLMFFYSMGCLLIGAFIAYKIINRKTDEEKENEDYLKELKDKL